jgi:hypothetical protein
LNHTNNMSATAISFVTKAMATLTVSEDAEVAAITAHVVHRLEALTISEDAEVAALLAHVIQRLEVLSVHNTDEDVEMSDAPEIVEMPCDRDGDLETPDMPEDVEMSD